MVCFSAIINCLRILQMVLSSHFYLSGEFDLKIADLILKWCRNVFFENLIHFKCPLSTLKSSSVLLNRRIPSFILYSVTCIPTLIQIDFHFLLL